MKSERRKKRIAILGGGPSGMFMFKQLIESGRNDFDITIFEKKDQLGAGMPYSKRGANEEHITNVSDNEIPQIVTSIKEWVQTAPKTLLQRFKINPDNFSEYTVLPRLFFGQYLAAQFDLLLLKAREKEIITHVHFESNVIDIIDQPNANKVSIKIEAKDAFDFNCVIISTGHYWPIRYEGKIPGYYDSPYPPSKLILKLNHPVALKGSSLTVIDAIRTLARTNGAFEKNRDGALCYRRAEHAPAFKIVMHSRNGLLPAVRFHLDDSHLSNDSLLTPEEIAKHISENNGFLSLDFIFEKNFKELFIEKDPAFYEQIKNSSLEEFVQSIMKLREKTEPFHLLRLEYEEAKKSIRRKQSIYWKELIATLSFALNYPAKHLSAEDMQRLQKELMPLISIIIAFVPQSSCEELLALHDAGVLDIVPVGDESKIEPLMKGGIKYQYKDETGNQHSKTYKTFIDCIGQPHLSYEEFPFKNLLLTKSVRPACLKFKSTLAGKKEQHKGNKDVEKNSSEEYYLKVPGIAISDNFQIIDQYGEPNTRIYMMAVPYIGGYNPDYSGLDFCNAASKLIVTSILENNVVYTH